MHKERQQQKFTFSKQVSPSTLKNHDKSYNSEMSWSLISDDSKDKMASWLEEKSLMTTNWQHMNDQVGIMKYDKKLILGTSLFEDYSHSFTLAP